MSDSIKLNADEVTEVRQLLAQHGLRVTPAQVQALVEFVDQNDGALDEAQRVLAALETLSAKAA